MSEFDDDGGPAFPVAEDHKTADQLPWTCGMSLRDWFAGQALAGITACGKRSVINGKELGADQAAYAIADAMLATRAKSQGGGQ